MPLDMQRAPKIPVGRAPSDLSRVEIEAVEDGSFIVTCFHKSKEGDGPMGLGAEPKRYTFQNTGAVSSFVTAKLEGRDTAGMKGGAPVEDEAAAAAPRRPKAPPVPPELPEPEDAELEAEY